MTDCAPVALFVYNRLDHTRRTIEALQRNELASETDLFIFSDAPKDADAQSVVQAVRDYIATVGGFRSTSVIERAHNFGLAASIMEGVTRICNEGGRVIVLEDDLLTAPYFLTYMNDALNLYQFEDQVIGIHGYMFPLSGPIPESFFLRDPGCWGWATWKRSWDLFDGDGTAQLAAIKHSGREREFDLDGSYDYIAMMEDRIAGRNNSWAILWYATAFLRGKLALYPGRSLVQNIGFDGSGVHSGKNDKFAVTLADRPIAVKAIPLAENRDVMVMLTAYLNNLRTPRSPLARAWARLCIWLGNARGPASR
jgi:hypothetical protein